MRKLRYGIIGSGFMGRTHAEAIQHIENAELIALTTGSRAPKLAEDYGVTLCESVDELIARDDIDVVIITTPQYAHVNYRAAVGLHRRSAEWYATAGQRRRWQGRRSDRPGAAGVLTHGEDCSSVIR